jgi:hypothetical protein
VRLQTSASLFIAALLTSAIVVGCDSTGSSPEDPPPDEEGAVSFSLVRTANSDVPSDADSAFVRVWRPSGNFNLVEFVNIPDPGQQTEVSLEVPADQGYRTGILAVKPEDAFSPLRKQILAHGSSDQFTVVSGDTSQVALDLRTADLTLKAPESLAPNKTDTIGTTYGINPPDIFPDLSAQKGTEPTFDFGQGTDLNRANGTGTDTTFTERFEITAPNTSSEDTTYVKVVFTNISADEEKWITTGRDIGQSFFPSRDGPSFEIPVVPGSGDDDGTVIIVFSMGEDGWEKTRRVVE